MKLYLSSNRIPNLAALTSLAGRTVEEIRVALVPNAKDYYAGRARAVKRREACDYFGSLGFQAEIVDLQQFSDADEVFKALEGFELIWAIGGNTFILRHQMQRSGFESAINRLLESGIIYGGESAGAVVAGNSLEGIEFADEPEFAESVIIKGLALVDHFVLPHVDSPDFGDAISQAREVHASDASLVELTDNQAFVVDGRKSKVVNADPNKS